MGLFSRLLGERSSVMEMSVTKRVVLVLEMLRAALAVHPDERVRSRWIHYDIKSEKDLENEFTHLPFFHISLLVASGVEIDANCLLFLNDTESDIWVHLGKREHPRYECRRRTPSCIFHCYPHPGGGMVVSHCGGKWATVSCTGTVTELPKQ